MWRYGVTINSASILGSLAPRGLLINIKLFFNKIHVKFIFDTILIGHNPDIYS